MMSTISENHIKKLGLKINALDRFLVMEGIRGGWVPYSSYVEVQLDILKSANFKEDVFILVVDDGRYTHWVPMAIGTLHIDRALDHIKDEEIENFSTEWRRGRLSMLLTLKSSQLVESKAEIFNLDQVRGDV